jgi:tRNA (mo5U34)-methyltransferase
MSELAVQPSLADRVAEVPSWYHCIRLASDLVTPGTYDTLDELERIPFPTSLRGKRCLDIGTADGFWAFEMERRGASEVVAIDLRDPARFDWPGNVDVAQRALWEEDEGLWRGFDVAHAALGSAVQWRELAVYELAPETIGTFDFVFMGSLLLHVRDPVAALAAIGSVLRGELLSVDAISPPLTLLHPAQPVARLDVPGRPYWWALNLRAYRRLFDAAGLRTLSAGRPFFVKPGSTYDYARSSRSPLLRLLERAALSRLGILHSWVRALPGDARLATPA